MLCMHPTTHLKRSCRLERRLFLSPLTLVSILLRMFPRASQYDDCGWGCAYRSLMSIISWYRLQGYTTFKNPTHYQVQLLLVEKVLLGEPYPGVHDSPRQ